MRRFGTPITLIVVWWAVLAVGFILMFSYSVRPSLGANAPREWPHTSELSRSKNGCTLVLIVNPHCSCAGASITELARLMTDLGDRVEARALFLVPANAQPGWERPEYGTEASRIPGAVVFRDTSGVEARRFGARSSGQALLYGPDGMLRFHGGITPDLGRPGDSPGRKAILRAVREDRDDVVASDVFGCALAELDRTPTPCDGGGTDR